jgi:hypothetical protein
MAENTATPVPKTVERFTFGKVRASAAPAVVPPEQRPVVIPSVPQPKPKLVEKLPATARPSVQVTGLRTDGPTIEEFVEAGGDPAEYPPEGYAERKRLYRFAKLSGTAARTTFPDKSFFQWKPIRRQGGGYAPTTSIETTDANLAAKLREAAKTDRSIREAPSQ